jgi:hypothetical protein
MHRIVFLPDIRPAGYPMHPYYYMSGFILTEKEEPFLFFNTNPSFKKNEKII